MHRVVRALHGQAVHDPPRLVARWELGTLIAAASRSTLSPPRVPDRRAKAEAGVRGRNRTPRSPSRPLRGPPSRRPRGGGWRSERSRSRRDSARSDAALRCTRSDSDDAAASSGPALELLSSEPSSLPLPLLLLLLLLLLSPKQANG